LMDTTFGGCPVVTLKYWMADISPWMFVKLLDKIGTNVTTKENIVSKEQQRIRHHHQRDETIALEEEKRIATLQERWKEERKVDEQHLASKKSKAGISTLHEKQAGSKNDSE